MTEITSHVRAILRDHAVVEGLSVRLTCGQLARSDYQAVNAALERAGGKWNRKVGAHLFDADPSEIIAGIVLTGQLPPKNPLAFFPTPAEVVGEMIRRAQPLSGMRVLEPSAGAGAIADDARACGALVTCVEISPYHATLLRAKHHTVHEQDFLAFDGEPFECVLMNPPFTVAGDTLAYITHIERAYGLLAPGGRLIAIAPNGFISRNDRRCAAFRASVTERGGWDELPEGAFRPSGTGVKAVMLWMDRP